MENYFGLVAAVILVVIVAVAFAVASNRADEAKSASRREQRGNKKATEKKSGKKGKQKNKTLPNVVFKSDGKVENEDEGMLDLIQGTAKYYAQEAKQASDAAAKKLQAAAAETKTAADKAVKGAKNAAKKVAAAVDEQIEEGTYTSVSRPVRKTKESKETSDENGTPETGRRKKQKAFLKTDVKEKGTPGEKGAPGEKKRREKKPEGATDAAGDNKTAEGEAKPQRQRKERPPRDDAAKTEGGVEGEEEKRPRREPREPREPRERKPPVFQPIPAPLAPEGDVLNKKNLDDMLGYMSKNFRVQETIFSKLAEVTSQRIARDARKYKDQNVAKRLRSVETLSGEQIIVKILSKLSLRDIIRVSQVDQFFSKFTRGDALWKSLGARDFGISAKENKDKQNNNKKDNKKPARAKALYRDKYDESKGRKPAKAAAKPKSTDTPKAEAPAATASPSEDKTQKKREKKPKDTSA